MESLIGLRESYTLSRLLTGASLSRFGDGELDICVGENARFQKYDADLAATLRAILWGSEYVVVGVPHAHGTRAEFWKDYLKRREHLFNQDVAYGSSFITRPDEAPWVDEDFFETLSRVWKRKRVVVVGSGSSLTKEKIKGARSVDFVKCPKRDAWGAVDHLEELIGKPQVALLCCGATATVLAERLAKKGIQAIDLGFIGKFM